MLLHLYDRAIGLLFPLDFAVRPYDHDRLTRTASAADGCPNSAALFFGAVGTCYQHVTFVDDILIAFQIRLRAPHNVTFGRGEKFGVVRRVTDDADARVQLPDHIVKLVICTDTHTVVHLGGVSSDIDQRI